MRLLQPTGVVNIFYFCSLPLLYILQQKQFVIHKVKLNPIILQLLKMSCYCKGHDLFRLCIGSQSIPHSCKNGKSQSQSNNQEANTIIEQIQKKYAIILQKQLKNLTDLKQSQIQKLEQTISKLKSQISKLQMRNKLDKDNQNRLKQQNKRQISRIKQLQQQLNREISNTKIKQQNMQTRTVEKVIEKVVNNENQQREINQLKQQLIKLKSKNFELQQLNKDLQNKHQSQRKGDKDNIDELNKKIKQLQGSLQNVQNQIASLQKQKVYLSQKVTILSKPVKSQIQPVVLNKIITHQPEIKTVYVDRPIQKTKIIQVEKIVRTFVQPERPIINRIIECPPSKNCKCDSLNSSRSSSQNKIDRIYDREETIKQQYNQILNSYKQERNKLVNLIHERDSNYRLLQKKVQLCEKLNKPSMSATNCKHTSDVQVTVYKDNYEQDPKPHITGQKKNRQSQLPKNTKRK